MKNRSAATLLAVCLTPPALGANILLVVDTTTLESSESARISSFQSWGHTVTTIQDGASQSAFDTATAAADVAYVAGSIDAPQLLYKLRTATCGVITEEPDLDTEFGYATGDGYTESSQSLEEVVNTHPVTTDLSPGSITVFTANAEMAPNGNTAAPGFVRLGNRAWGQIGLGVIEAGDALANSYNGNSVAAGRRVRMPWSDINWYSLDSDGESIVRRALDWASGGSATGLLLHWRLDELSGVTAADSSDHDREGTLTGSASWTPGRRDGGLELQAGAKVSVDGLLGEPASFTVAAWARLDSADSSGAEVLSVGDHIGLRLDSGGQCRVFFDNGSSWTNLAATHTAAGAGWRHYAAVFDDAANSLRLYIDGVLVAQSSTNDSIDYNGLGDATVVGGHGDGKAAFDFDGALDDVRVYGDALSEAEIADVYGLLAHWKFDEGSGATIADSSLTGAHAAVSSSSPVWASGKDGGALAFDGVNDAAATDAVFDPPGEGTVAFWFRNEGAPATRGRLFGISDGWEVRYESGGALHLDIGKEGSGTPMTATLFDKPGAWNHLVYLYSDTDDDYEVYVNGVLDSSGTASLTDQSAGVLSFGTRTGSSEYFEGTLDDVRVYNRRLTLEEITALQAEGLIAHWRFDEGSGTTVADDSGHGNDAAFGNGNPTWTAGVRGAALEFDGSSDAATDSAFDPPATASLAFWFRGSATPSGTQRLLGATGNWEVRTDASGAVSFDVAGSGGGSFQTNDGVVGAGRWRHVVAIYNSADDTHRLYVDGRLVSSGAFTCADESAATLTFGSRTGSSQRFNGALDDVRVYNYELTAAEVAEVYGLVGHWKFDDETGNTATDSSGAGNDALHSGLALWGSGVRGGAAEFDGGNGHFLNSSIADQLNGYGGFGAVLWVKSDLTGVDGDILFGAVPDGSDNNVSLRYDKAGWGGGGTDLVKAAIRSEGGGAQTEGEDDAQSTHWSHLAVSWRSGEALRLWVDGSEQHASYETYPSAGAVSGVTRLMIGNGTKNKAWDGLIDDLRVYNRALTDEERATHHGLIGHWVLDDSSGSVAADASGMGRHGTYLGSPTLAVAGPKSGLLAADFDGDDDVVLLPACPEDFDDGVSISVWAKPTAANHFAKFLQITDGTSKTIDLGRRSSDNTLRGDAGSDLWVAGALHGGVWRHYAMSVDSVGEMRLYRNGALVGVAATTAPAAGPRSDGWIGGSSWPSDGLFEGQMHDARLYNRPISAEEARALYYGEAVSGLRIVEWVEAPNP